ncbi:maleylpyruvate isomerase family mycothiol-dependent enzyme [Streptomyces seoulensis]|uniref:maleylpyruvate isomerase family mycothiol-dependent enzyme n=1 Tax=Streptomyces seoulensis TaxID=73044 RepID=UPI003C2B858B
MDETLGFPDLLRLIDERSNAFRAAVASAPSLDGEVPTCPEWTLFDLVRHLGEGRRKWAAIVAAGPAGTPPPRSAWDVPAAPAEREALLDWWTASASQLLDALRDSGPDRGCWSWWETSQSPRTVGAAARHQLQEIAVHTYDAQLTAGAPQPLPTEVALDGVDEFLSTCCATTSPWPHQPATVDYQATEGSSWRLTLSPGGVRAARLPDTAAPADASLRGTAAELVLALHGRIPVDSLKTDGDRRLFGRLLDWDPDAPSS